MSESEALPTHKESVKINNEDIGKRIQILRKSSVLTQEELAIKLNISLRQMGHIETGRRGLTIENAILLAETFSQTLDYIYLGRHISEGMIPVCQLVYATVVHLQGKEQEDFYIDTTTSLSKIMLKL
jgi:transcriptional regulator with XRE-family HTH domain